MQTAGAQPAKYQLQPFFTHIGNSPSSGHYVTYARANSPGTWVCCDDENVIASSAAAALSSNPYLLFYKVAQRGNLESGGQAGLPTQVSDVSGACRAGSPQKSPRVSRAAHGPAPKRRKTEPGNMWNKSAKYLGNERKMGRAGTPAEMARFLVDSSE